MRWFTVTILILLHINALEVLLGLQRISKLYSMARNVGNVLNKGLFSLSFIVEVTLVLKKAGLIRSLISDIHSDFIHFLHFRYLIALWHDTTEGSSADQKLLFLLLFLSKSSYFVGMAYLKRLPAINGVKIAKNLSCLHYQKKGTTLKFQRLWFRDSQVTLVWFDLILS